MNSEKRVALYARFSSDNQRSESIDAQIRAMEEYCRKNGWIIVAKYTDEAMSATTDRRPGFQKMMADSEQKLFDIVLVHKLDRFCRNRYDSANYKYRLRKNGVILCSALERLDDSPESIILESLLEGMAEYYSKNLAREVMKGLKENALHCKHNGGSPPYGYDLDNEKHLIINPQEAKVVQLMFELYLRGYTMSEIAEMLNEQGYRNKVGKPFGMWSVQTVLKNEKYTGIYIYNRVEAKDASNKRSNREKPAEEIIKIPGGCPTIITTEIFEKSRQIRKLNQRVHHRNKKIVYLCSGVMFCGCCGKRMTGTIRYGSVIYHAYTCTENRDKCSNIKEVDKEKLEQFVVRFLHKKIFNEAIFRAISEGNHENTVYRSINTDEYIRDYQDMSDDRIQDNVLKNILQRYVSRITVNQKISRSKNPIKN